MSKSLGNYIALEDKPEEMFGKVMSISDTLMLRYYELLTTEDLTRVKSLHPMDAKQALAEQIVVRYHGAGGGTAGEGGVPAEVSGTGISCRAGRTGGLDEGGYSGYGRGRLSASWSWSPGRAWFPARAKRAG
ncbi:MAG: hypothetical protein KatS3mg082_0419 [Nitrospiraceae bacterium]|nr:MAG: hypothetical protein KatS3mg082_0419 [Nitrospiraceae bacterium]